MKFQIIKYRLIMIEEDKKSNCDDYMSMQMEEAWEYHRTGVGVGPTGNELLVV